MGGRAADRQSKRAEAIIKKVAEGVYRTLLKMRDEATISIQGTQNTAHNQIARLSTDAREWNAALAQHVRGRLKDTSDQAIEGMADATKQLNEIVEIVGPIAGSMEKFVDELDYVTPALPQNAERRLRRLALHTGLICSALTTVSIGLTILLLRKVGL